MTAKPKTPRKAPKSDRSFITLLAVLFLIGGGAIGYVALKPKATTATVVVSSIPMPNAKGKVIGSDSAKVEMVMFGDFECPGCAQHATLTEPQIRENLVATGLIRYRFVDFPLPSHPSTMFAHRAAACANEQQKFWPMHDLIYSGQLEWSEGANRRDMNASKVLRRYASQLGLDMKAYDDCVAAGRVDTEIMGNQREGERFGVRGTPQFLIGKRLLDYGTKPYDLIKAYVDSALAEARDTTTKKQPD